MKKILLITLLAFSAFAVGAGNGDYAVPREKVTRLINEFKGQDGFNVVKIGSIGTSIMKSIFKMTSGTNDDPDMRNAAEIIKNIKKITVVEYDGCSQEIQKNFSSKMERILKPVGLIMEVKDNGETMRMYGIVNDDSSVIKDFLMFSPESCTIVCLFGTIPLDALAKMMD